MRQVMISYRVKQDRVAEIQELVRAVYEELASKKPVALSEIGSFRFFGGGAG